MKDKELKVGRWVKATPKTLPEKGMCVVKGQFKYNLEAISTMDAKWIRESFDQYADLHFLEFVPLESLKVFSDQDMRSAMIKAADAIYVQMQNKLQVTPDFLADVINKYMDKVKPVESLLPVVPFETEILINQIVDGITNGTIHPFSAKTEFLKLFSPQPPQSPLPVELIKIRNELIADLPLGNAGAWSFLQAINKHINKLDKLIEKIESYPQPSQSIEAKESVLVRQFLTDFYTFISNGETPQQNEIENFIKEYNLPKIDFQKRFGNSPLFKNSSEPENVEAIAEEILKKHWLHQNLSIEFFKNDRPFTYKGLISALCEIYLKTKQ